MLPSAARWIHPGRPFVAGDGVPEVFRQVTQVGRVRRVHDAERIAALEQLLVAGAETDLVDVEVPDLALQTLELQQRAQELSGL